MPIAALLGGQSRLARRHGHLQELFTGLVRSLTMAIDAKDAYTFGHSERVARIAVELGRELRLPEAELNALYLGGLLHDIGKIGVRDSVLNKTGPLSPEEAEEVRQHVHIGHRILADIDALSHLLPLILHHHERIDGTGYPAGLQGEAIPLLARVLAVADSFDAMNTPRSYRATLTRPQIEETLKQGAGSQWDARVIGAFFLAKGRIQAIQQRGIGESVCLAFDGAFEQEAPPVILGIATAGAAEGPRRRASCTAWVNPAGRVDEAARITARAER
jgi:putative nucleotidyltransferase with HDIG domain